MKVYTRVRRVLQATTCHPEEKGSLGGARLRSGRQRIVMFDRLADFLPEFLTSGSGLC